MSAPQVDPTLAKRLQGLEDRLAAAERSHINPLTLSDRIERVAVLPTTNLYEGRLIRFQTAAMEAVGVAWYLEYRGKNADGTPNTSLYRWEVVNGLPLYHSVGAREGTTSVSPADLATMGPIITAPLAGEYYASFAARLVESINGTGGMVTLSLSGVAVNDATMEGYLSIGTTVNEFSPSEAVPYVPVTVTTAGQTVRMRYQYVGGLNTVTFEKRKMTLAPIRVG